MRFNIIDIIFLLCLIPALFGGIKKGFIRQLAALAALLLGVWIAWRFSHLFTDLVRSWTKTDGTITQIITFAALFFGVILLINLLGRLLQGLINLALLGWLDKMLGVLFAILKYSFIISILIYLLESLDKLYPFLPRELILESSLYPIISKLSSLIFPFLKIVNETIKSTII